jgi:TonB family protein
MPGETGPGTINMIDRPKYVTAKSDSMNRNRRHARHLITPRLYVAMNGSSAGGILYDVSVGGMSLDVVGPKPAGERVLLDFDMSETGEHFEGSGRIIWKSEAGNRVGIQFVDLPEASHLKIKSWLSAKSISGSGGQNVVVQDRGDGPFMEYPSWLRERASSPTTSAVLEPPQNEKNLVSEYAERPAPAPTPVPAQPAPIAPITSDALSNAILASETEARATRDLRTAFSNRLAAEPQPEQEAVQKAPQDWKQVRQWLLTAAVVLLAVLLLAAAIKISASQNFTVSEAYRGFKSMAAKGMAKLLSSSAPSQVAPPRIAYTNPAPNKDARSPGTKHVPAGPEINPGTSSNSPATDKFEVLDAQHGRRYFPRTSTNLIVQFQKTGKLELGDQPSSQTSVIGRVPAGATASSVAQTGAKTPDQIASNIESLRFGRVLRESSGELPITETMPDYPSFALQTNVQGRVVLTALITKNGNLEDVRILSAPSVLDSAALEAVRTWRYQPHLENGAAVEVVTEIIVDFSITTK